MQASYNDWEDAIIKKAFLPKEDLTQAEKDILKISYDIFSSIMEDLSYFEDEIKRLTIENNNLKDLNKELINETKTEDE